MEQGGKDSCEKVGALPYARPEKLAQPLRRLLVCDDRMRGKLSKGLESSDEGCELSGLQDWNDQCFRMKQGREDSREKIGALRYARPKRAV